MTRYFDIELHEVDPEDVQISFDDGNNNITEGDKIQTDDHLIDKFNMLFDDDLSYFDANSNDFEKKIKKV